MTTTPRPFRYLLDPVCLASIAIYLLNRFVLKPHHLGGAFTHGYLNDILCLPLFLPIILYLQRRFHLRTHDGPPRAWEVLQHWLVFSIVFEVMLPRYPQTFHTTADPLDAVAYLTGGALAWIYWKGTCHATPRANSIRTRLTDALAPRTLPARRVDRSASAAHVR